MIGHRCPITQDGPILPNSGKQPDHQLVRIYMYLQGVYLNEESGITNRPDRT